MRDAPTHLAKSKMVVNMAAFAPTERSTFVMPALPPSTQQKSGTELEQAQKLSQTGTETFQAWIQTRTATTNPQQDLDAILGRG